MSEIFDPTVHQPALDSPKVTLAGVAARAREKVLGQTKLEPVRIFSMVLVGSVLASFLLGCFVSRMGEDSRKRRLIEDWAQEVTNWMRQHGRKMTVPIRDSLQATKSAFEEISRSGARVGPHLRPFFKKQKRLFSNLF